MNLLYPNFRKQSTYYIQKLIKLDKNNIQIYRKNYGVKDEEKKEILKMFDLSTMGASEYEYERFGNHYNFIKENNDNYISEEIDFLGMDYYIIVHKDYLHKFYIDMHYATEGNQKVSINLLRELDSDKMTEGYFVYDSFLETKGWMFFSDKEMFLKVCKKMKIKKNRNDYLNKFESFIEEVKSLKIDNFSSFLKKNRIKKIDNSILSKWGLIDFIYFYNKSLFFEVIKNNDFFSFKNKLSLFSPYGSGGKMEQYLIKDFENIKKFDNLFHDKKISNVNLDILLSQNFSHGKPLLSFLENQLSFRLLKNNYEYKSIIQNLILLQSDFIKDCFTKENIDEFLDFVTSNFLLTEQCEELYLSLVLYFYCFYEDKNIDFFIDRLLEKLKSEIQKTSTNEKKYFLEIEKNVLSLIEKKENKRKFKNNLK